MSRHVDSLWGVILAAGDGARLAPLTSALYGHDLPKQFTAIDGRRSLLQMTVERVSGLIDPHRILVVVGTSQENIARAQLADHSGIEIIAQPRNIGTGPGVLLPLAWILGKTPSAEVAIFPSDHYIPNPEPFLHAVEEALAVVRAQPDLITMLGVVPDRAETDYGYVLPGVKVSGTADVDVHSVRRFVEKPSEHAAQRLLEHHALWNTFTLAGNLLTYWRLARKCLPRQAHLFERYAGMIGGPHEKAAISALYEKLSPADFSRSVLAHATNLATVSVEDSGWCDWGRPERVMQSLAGTALLEQLQQRMRWGGGGGVPHVAA
jgi:mannose-1-phosphate guanylyltransferase